MGADIKALRIRIKSVDSTRHLTKAMGLVASSKIRRANEAMSKAAEYRRSLLKVADVLVACPECKKSPYMRRGGERTRIITIAGDRGLAGGYNANIFRLAKEFCQAEFIPVGKRACDRFGKEGPAAESFSTEDAYRMAQTLCRDFCDGLYDRLEIIYTKYISMMTQEATHITILPLTLSEPAKSQMMIFEPDELSVLDAAVTEYVAGSITAAVRESFASEIAARRMAMDSAQKNAGKMISDLQLQYNRARQSAITQEITEIVAGSGN